MTNSLPLWTTSLLDPFIIRNSYSLNTDLLDNIQISLTNIGLYLVVSLSYFCILYTLVAVRINFMNKLPLYPCPTKYNKKYVQLPRPKKKIPEKKFNLKCMSSSSLIKNGVVVQGAFIYENNNDPEFISNIYSTCPTTHTNCYTETGLKLPNTIGSLNLEHVTETITAFGYRGIFFEEQYISRTGWGYIKFPIIATSDEITTNGYPVLNGRIVEQHILDIDENVRRRNQQTMEGETLPK